MSFFPCKTVVVPVDFSEESIESVEFALSLVERPDGLYVINVAIDVVSGDPGFPWNVAEESIRAAEITATLEQRLGALRFRGLHTQVAFGDPGTQIAAFANQLKADLVVIPSHGRTGLKRMLIGSVAERVTRLCHCPVLVLRNGSRT